MSDWEKQRKVEFMPGSSSTRDPEANLVYRSSFKTETVSKSEQKEEFGVDT